MFWRSLDVWPTGKTGGSYAVRDLVSIITASLKAFKSVNFFGGSTEVDLVYKVPTYTSFNEWTEEELNEMEIAEGNART